MATKPALKLAALALVTLGLTTLLSLAISEETARQGQVVRFWPSYLGAQSAQAQPVRIQELGGLVYELMPDLPLENDYVSQASGEADLSNTLASRLIRYHLYVKGRPPVYRLDWKLTLADYLGANERMFVSIYPGWDTLQTNPMEGDIAAIERLTRAQREQLVQTLVTIFNQSESDTATPNSASPATPAEPAPRPVPTTPSTPAYPQPGDAQLLMP